ncbi:hypothetical protein B0J14DRAFT_656650 [Halenospora varia]|nr:hypothetical protein B0J14DRAFT_656650 [Halenospora varia]
MDTNPNQQTVCDLENNTLLQPPFSGHLSRDTSIGPVDHVDMRNMVVDQGDEVSTKSFSNGSYYNQQQGSSFSPTPTPLPHLFGQPPNPNQLPPPNTIPEPDSLRHLFDEDKNAAEKEYDAAVIKHFNHLEMVLRNELQFSQVEAQATVDPLFVGHLRDTHNDDWITRRTESILDKEVEQLRDFAKSEHASSTSSSKIPLPILPATLKENHPLNEFLKIMKPEQPYLVSDVDAWIFLFRDRDFLRCYCIHRSRVIEFERNKKEREEKRIKRKRRDNNTRARKKPKDAAEAALEKQSGLQSNDQ